MYNTITNLRSMSSPPLVCPGTYGPAPQVTQVESLTDGLTNRPLYFLLRWTLTLVGCPPLCPPSVYGFHNPFRDLGLWGLRLVGGRRVMYLFNEKKKKKKKNKKIPQWKTINRRDPRWGLKVRKEMEEVVNMTEYKLNNFIQKESYPINN